MRRINAKLLHLAILFCLFILGSFLNPIFAADEEPVEGVISEIKITGNRLIPETDIISQIQSSPGQRLTKELVVEDLRRIYNLGYFAPKQVEARPYRKPDGTVMLEYTIAENPPVTDLIIYGGENIPEINAYAVFSDLIGKPENARLLSDRIKLLEALYVRQGYLITKVDDIDFDESGTLKIYIDEGKINAIKYNGNKKTRESYLGYIVTNTKAGEPYNEANFIKDYKKLQSLGYFNNVSRAVVPNENGNGYTLEIQLTEKEKFTSIGAGGGINSSAGLFGNANISVGNIHGKGETLNITALLGSGFGAGSTLNTNSKFVRRGQYTAVDLGYSIPYFRGSQFNLRNYANFSRGPNFTVDLSKQTLISGGATFAKSIGGNQSLSLGGAANYIDVSDRDRQAYVNRVANNIRDIDGVTKAFAKIEARELRDSQIMSGMFFDLRPSYALQDVDDQTNPRSGHIFRLGAAPTLGFGDVDSFSKITGSVSRFIPLPKQSSMVLNFRGGFNLLGTVPQFAKFRLGTTTGVRGYRQITDLGVGDKFGITTAELRTPIYNVIPAFKNKKILKSLDIAAFADAGLIGGDIRLNRVTDRLSQAASFGVGLRVRVPLVGALRLDVGFPVIQALTNKRLFRFNFGPANIF